VTTVKYKTNNMDRKSRYLGFKGALVSLARLQYRYGTAEYHPGFSGRVKQVSWLFGVN
jgi:hypothetical protein